ncbi:MAG TPA: molybdate ABC transporter substrate-binding protein [Anaerolineales bacterium]|nr:molybdate ABC transporter substrate-binding protein [Anaerolineales bacterium]
MTLLLASCRAAPNPAAVRATLVVFAASSLTDAFTEIGTAFEQEHPGVDVALSFGGSQMLRTQIEAGAPADVFAAANSSEVEKLVDKGMVEADAVRPFLSNRLIVILPAQNPARVQNLQDLAAPGIKVVLAAQEVPVGNYARQSLMKMGTAFGVNFPGDVLKRVVSNEDNARQVVAKIQLGEADAGIVYVSDAISAQELRTIEIPQDLNVIATYPIAPLTRSGHPAEAASFVEYVLSPRGQAILKAWGFAPPQP